MSKTKLTAIDLFCGCGGISCGLKQAGFNIIAGADVEQKYSATFKHNFPDAKLFHNDLTKITTETFMKDLHLEPGELMLLAGGPPCQGFSKNVPRKHRYLDDPKNQLIRTFLDFCRDLRPQLILMENVAEMKNGFNLAYTEEIISRLKEDNYSVSYAVLNAADYGVPQRRRRAFFIANRLGTMLNFPHPTHGAPKDDIGLFSVNNHVTVWDAIGDLPSLNHGEGDRSMSYACAPISSYQKKVRNGQEYVENHVARKLQPLQFKRISALKPGEGLKELPEHLKVRSGYSGAYGRLTKDMVAPTITRWVFHPGSGRWGHPVDLRILTIREVARIQGFPDSFVFVGTYNDQAGQIGNAVPPLLIQEIAESMLAQAELSNSNRNSKNLSNDIFSFSDGRAKVIA